MAHDQTATPQCRKPDPALKRLEKLVGTWELTGRTLGAKQDDISGRVVVDWLPGGFFLEQRGEMEIMGVKVASLEVLGYDAETDTFLSVVFSNLDGVPAAYRWDVRGDVVTHWAAGAKFTGKFSEDGNTLAGGWRPDAGIEPNAGNTYDEIMTRVK